MDELAEQVIGTDFMIAEMDRNGMSSLVTGYPTIFFYPKKGPGLIYEGGKNMEDLTQYLYENSPAYKRIFLNPKLKVDGKTTVHPAILTKTNHS